MSNPAPVDNLLAKLDGVKPAGRGKWSAKCPAHDDAHASLSIGTGDDGRALVHCQAGCSTADVLAAVGLSMADLFPPKDTAPRRPPAMPQNRKLPQAPPDTSPKAKGNVKKEIVETYDYRDSSGAMLFQVVRYDPKDFRQRRPDGAGGWTWNLGDTRRVLYRLPELLAALKANPDVWVFIVEGEKDVDALWKIGLVATCNPGGAGKWKNMAVYSALDGRRVAIVPDRDGPGLAHAQDVARRLHGKAAVVKILDQLDGEIDGRPIKDVSDWLDARDSVSPEDLAAGLVGMADTAPDWAPPVTESAAPSMSAATSGPVLTCLADVKPEAVRWLWEQRIALGKLTVFAGRPDLGKSFVTLDLAARVSRGDSFPLYPANIAPPGDVVLLSAEDDLKDTIRPRLDAAGADVKRIHALTTVQTGVNFSTGKPILAPFNVADNLPMLEAAIRQRMNCRLVVIDPISAFLGKTDSHNNAEVRGVLAPLAEMAARYRVAVVAVSHFNKGAGEAINLVMGSLAFVAAARAAFVFVKDRDDPTGARRFMLPLKNNLSADRAGLAYRLLSPSPGAMAAVAWEALAVNISLEDAVTPDDRRRGPEPKAQQEAAAWLRDFLAGGPRPATECTTEAQRQGISPATLRRAKEACGIVYQNGGFQAPWTWRLPDWENPFEPAPPSVVHPPPVSNNLSNMSNTA